MRAIAGSSAEKIALDPGGADPRLQSRLLERGGNLTLLLRLWPLAGPRSWLWRGAFAACAGVACLIALPWPVRELFRLWNLSPGKSPPAWTAGLPGWLAPEAALAVAFCLLGLLMGWAEYVQRIWFARFAIAWTRNLRAAAFRAVVSHSPRDRRIESQELVARLIGDAVRFKSGVKGFLIYVATNGILALGVTLVGFWTDPWIGLIFALTALLTALVAWWGGRRSLRAALLHRGEEGRLARYVDGSVQELPGEDSFAEANRDSGLHENALTTLQAQSGWLVHGIVGLAALSMLVLGADWVSQTDLRRSELLIFLAYLTLLHRPLVRLARHGARSGKLLACASRLEHTLHEHGPPCASGPELAELSSEIVLRTDEPARAASGAGLELRLGAGQKLAVLGADGAGKSRLLALLAGTRDDPRAELLWDGRPLRAFPESERARRVGFLSDETHWRERRLRDLLGLPPGELPPHVAQLLAVCGMSALAARLKRGFETRLAPESLARHERRLLSLARAMLKRPSLLVLDDPLAGLPAEQAHDLHDLLLAQPGALAAAHSRTPDLAGYDRVLELSGGRVEFDGPLREWRARAASPPARANGA